MPRLFYVSCRIYIIQHPYSVLYHAILAAE